jgi:hypothetical protein
MNGTAKPKPSRTIGPLHFEDLEPHRFEDLVRQLIYDFRGWKQLEATVRTGSDDGFDARGFEGTPEREIDNGDDEEQGERLLAEDRVWLIQCKREKQIGPKKLVAYFDAIGAEEASQLYGIVFAAACDFSKAARDAFRHKTRSMGLAEAHLWGKAEIEDMLYQPKNDHLLFAYFGISLQVRRRSLQSNLRARLAAKRKATKCLQNWGAEVLIRDASDERYPYFDGDAHMQRFDRGRWGLYNVDRCQHDGVHILFRRHLAFLADDEAGWDYAEKMNDASPLDNPWMTDADEEIVKARRAARHEAMEVWDQLPEKNRAWFEIFLIVPYDSILAIDEDGDEFFKGPHIYTAPFTAAHGPFLPYERVKLETIGQWSARQGIPGECRRVKIFPRPSSERG